MDQKIELDRYLYICLYFGSLTDSIKTTHDSKMQGF